MIIMKKEKQIEWKKFLQLVYIVFEKERKEKVIYSLMAIFVSLEFILLVKKMFIR